MFVYAMEFDELVKEFKKRVVINDKAILLIYLADKVYAIDDRCGHMGASLVKGTVKENTVECKSHHAVYQVETGKVLEKAHIGIVKMPTKSLGTYETEVKDQKIYVKM